MSNPLRRAAAFFSSRKSCTCFQVQLFLWGGAVPPLCRARRVRAEREHRNFAVEETFSIRLRLYLPAGEPMKILKRFKSPLHFFGIWLCYVVRQRPFWRH